MVWYYICLADFEKPKRAGKLLPIWYVREYLVFEQHRYMPLQFLQVERKLWQDRQVQWIFYECGFHPFYLNVLSVTFVLPEHFGAVHDKSLYSLTNGLHRPEFCVWCLALTIHLHPRNLLFYSRFYKIIAYFSISPQNINFSTA